MNGQHDLGERKENSNDAARFFSVSVRFREDVYPVYIFKSVRHCEFWEGGVSLVNRDCGN